MWFPIPLYLLPVVFFFHLSPEYTFQFKRTRPDLHFFFDSNNTVLHFLNFWRIGGEAVYILPLSPPKQVLQFFFFLIMLVFWFLLIISACYLLWIFVELRDERELMEFYCSFILSNLHYLHPSLVGCGSSSNGEMGVEIGGKMLIQVYLISSVTARMKLMG